MAIIYEGWLDGRVPKNWKKAAVLEIKDINAVLGDTKVTIYSINPEIHNALMQNVKNFDWNKNVDVKIIE